MTIIFDSNHYFIFFVCVCNCSINPYLLPNLLTTVHVGEQCPRPRRQRPLVHSGASPGLHSRGDCECMGDQSCVLSEEEPWCAQGGAGLFPGQPIRVHHYHHQRRIDHQPHIRLHHRQ